LVIETPLSTDAALAVARALLLPLAFGGGLFRPPEAFPGWLNSISTWLPTRAGRDLVVTATTGVNGETKGYPTTMSTDFSQGYFTPQRS
jgi:ABC-2 type transport system permease protein